MFALKNLSLFTRKALLDQTKLTFYFLKTADKRSTQKKFPDYGLIYQLSNLQFVCTLSGGRATNSKVNKEQKLKKK